MSRLRTGEKVHRVTRFMLGLRNRRVAEAMALRGFGQQDFDEGWQLLREVIGTRFSWSAPAASTEPSTIEALDQWENTWFPVADATLKFRSPEVHQALFLNLSQTEGPEVAISVGLFLKRLGALAKGSTNEQAAYTLLQKRGLTDAVIASAKNMIETLGTLQPPAPVNLEAQRLAAEKAETAMWNWYLEWSTLAQSIITEPALLKLMGYRSSKPPRTMDGDATDEGDMMEEEGEV